ncbi:MAG TPA: nitroreductase family protein [Thermomicrobiales bacterium]|nr:nitroreductase family protein [Thermomicrobiales bacterium]
MPKEVEMIPAPTPAERQPLADDALEAFGTVIRGRRSVRRFRPDPLPDELVDRVLEAGLWAPSPHGTQPWRFAVLRAVETRAQLADAMAASWRHNLAMDGESEEVILGRLAGSRRRLTEAPVLILVSLDTRDLDHYPDPARAAAERTMAIQSLGACVQNMLLAAHANGIDAGWMCAPLFCPEIVVASLGLDPAIEPQALLALGHAAADPKRRPRRSLGALLVFDDRDS